MYKKLKLNGMDQKITMSADQVVSFHGKGVRITCLAGSVWVTGPGPLESTLSKGMTLDVNPKGKICIQAFSDALIAVRGTRYVQISPLSEISKRLQWIPLKDAC